MKKISIFVITIILTIGLSATLVTPAQNDSTAIDFESRFLLATGHIMLFEYKSKDEKANNAPEQLVNIYYEAAQDPELTKIVCKHILDTYHSMHGSAKSAAQVSQIADEARVKFDLLQTMQNAYMIKLLKEK